MTVIKRNGSEVTPFRLAAAVVTLPLVALLIQPYRVLLEIPSSSAAFLPPFSLASFTA